MIGLQCSQLSINFGSLRLISRHFQRARFPVGPVIFLLFFRRQAIDIFHHPRPVTCKQRGPNSPFFEFQIISSCRYRIQPIRSTRQSPVGPSHGYRPMRVVIAISVKRVIVTHLHPVCHCRRRIFPGPAHMQIGYGAAVQHGVFIQGIALQ